MSSLVERSDASVWLEGVSWEIYLHLRRFWLEENEYAERQESQALPGFPRELAEGLLIERAQHGDTTLVQRFPEGIATP